MKNEASGGLSKKPGSKYFLRALGHKLASGIKKERRGWRITP